MRRAGYILGALLALGGAVRADQGWQDYQNTNGFVSIQPASDCPMQSYFDGTVGCAPVTPQAIWPLAGVRVFAVNGSGGSDTNQCWADSADTTNANVAIATAAAGAKACATLAGAAAELPPVGDNHQAYVVVAAGTYGDSLAPFNHAKGYAAVRFRATGTNSTAGATAFAGDANDLTYEGAVTAAGMNSAGYNPTSSSTGTILTLQKAGGGSPAFPAEPAKPLMVRARFDSATTTSALRNQVFSALAVLGTNQITIPSSITYVSTDVLYLEDPGVLVTGTSLNDMQSVSINGFSMPFLQVSNGGIYSVSFCQMISFGTFLSNGSQFNTATISDFDPNPTIGPSILGPATGISVAQVNVGNNSAMMTGSSNVIDPVGPYSIGQSNVVAGAFFLRGRGGSNLGVTFGGGGNNTQPQLATRFLSVLQVQGGEFTINNVNFPNSTDATAIQLQGECSMHQIGPLFGGTKTLAGIDISAARNSRIDWVSPGVNATLAPTLAGANGAITAGPSGAGNANASYASWTALQSGAVFLGSTLISGGPGGDWVPTRARPVLNTTASIIPRGSIVQLLIAGGGYAGVSPAFADNATDISQALGILLDDLPAASATIAGFAVFDGQWHAAASQDGTCGHPIASAGLPVYVSATTAGDWTCARPTTGLVRQIGWTIAENTISLTPDNLLQPVSQVYSAGTPEHTEPGLNFSSDFSYADNSGALRGDVGLSSVGIGAGSCTACNVTFDAKGRATTYANGSGGGGVSSVTGTPQRASATPTTGAVVVDTIGAFYSGAASGGNEDLGGLSNGTLEQTVSAGVATIAAFNGTLGSVPFYTTSGQLAQDNTNFVWDPTNHALDLHGGINTTVLPTVAGASLLIDVTAGHAAQVSWSQTGTIGGSIILNSNTTEFYMPTTRFWGSTTTQSGGVVVINSGLIAIHGNSGGVGGATLGALQIDSQSTQTGIALARTNGRQDINKTTTGTGAVTLGVGTADSNSMVLYTNGTTAVTVTTAQQLNVPVTVAPSTPAATTATIYVDSTSKNVCAKNDAGTVNHGIQTTACIGSHWMNQVADNGISGCTQPAFTDVNGSAACSQLPALTGGVTSSAGSCATVVASVPCSALPALTGAVTSSAGSCSTAVNFTGLTGSLTCSQTPAFTGDSTKVAGSCATVNVALTETSGPQSLTVGAWPDLAPNAAVGIRPAGTTTIVGLDSTQLIVSDKLVYYESLTLGVSGGWIATSDSVTVLNGTAIEYPISHEALHSKMCVNLITNGIVSGSPTFAVTRNGTSIGGGLAIAIGSGTPTGVQCTSSVATGSTSASDTYGVAEANSATGTVKLTLYVVLN